MYQKSSITVGVRLLIISYKKDIACNAGASSSSGLCEVQRKYKLMYMYISLLKLLYNTIAGDEITVEMHQQPGDRSCSNEALGGNHYGPMMVRHYAGLEGPANDHQRR